MSNIRGIVLEILEKTETSVLVRAEYTGGHKSFSPVGFTYEFNEKLDEVEVGYIWVVAHYKKSKLIDFCEGHDAIMKKFSEDLEKLFNKNL